MANMIDRLNAFLVTLATARAALGLRDPLGFEVNRKFARVFSVSGSFRSAVVFVDLESGDVYRADSWRARGRLMQKAGV